MSHYSNFREKAAEEEIRPAWQDHLTEQAFFKDNPITTNIIDDKAANAYDSVHKPKHYNSYPGVEVIQITQHMNFCKGNAIKYLARAEFKGSELEDLRKALWYINKEIERITSNDK